MLTIILHPISRFPHNLSMALDFEDYTREWRTMATSMPSDADRKKLYSVAAGLDVKNY